MYEDKPFRVRKRIEDIKDVGNLFRVKNKEMIT